jgi:hypothetical protein
MTASVAFYARPVIVRGEERRGEERRGEERRAPTVPPFVLVGATGFEPVTSSVSAKPREPLC